MGPSFPVPCPMLSTPAASVTLHARLREATAHAHEQLESLLGLLESPMSYTRFVAVLMRFHGFHRAWEPALEAALGDEAFTLPRRRLTLIEHDLRALDIDDLDIEALPVVPEAAQLCRTLDGALGSLYVMEGSTLGGRVITRRLLEDADWCPAEGLLYFHPYGDLTGERWRQTLALLATVPPERQEAVVDGALETFALLLQWLEPAVVAANRVDDDTPSEWGVAL